MSIVRWAAERSTCQKRRTVCILYDALGHVLSIGWNQCTPPQGICVRLGSYQRKEGYTGTECESIHAEAAALKGLPEGVKANRADVYGHDFACPACEEKLKAHGIKETNIIPAGYGSGLLAQKPSIGGKAPNGETGS